MDYEEAKRKLQQRQMTHQDFGPTRQRVKDAMKTMGGALTLPFQMLTHSPEADAAFIGMKGARNLGGDVLKRMLNFHTLEAAKEKELPQKTGAWRGPRNILRTEISDEPMRLIKDISVPSRGVLSDYVDHPELFKAYPEITRYPVVVDPNSDAWSVSDYGQLTIGDSKDIPEQNIREVLAHELQHIVQNQENFFPSTYDDLSSPYTYEEYLEFPWEQEARIVGRRAKNNLEPNPEPYHYPSQDTNAPYSRYRPNPPARSPLSSFLRGLQVIEPTVDNTTTFGFDGY